jgi:hypothetical protein
MPKSAKKKSKLVAKFTKEGRRKSALKKMTGGSY